MGRGLSSLQHDILGLAYAVNAYTQYGTHAVKTGRVTQEGAYRTVEYNGPSDIKVALAIYALRQIAPSNSSPGFFHATREYQAGKAAITRAIIRLLERELLISTSPKWNPHRLYQWGYVLTADGFEIAKEIESNPPGLADAVELFGIKAGATFEAEKCNPKMKWLTYFDWIYGSLYACDERQKLIKRLQEEIGGNQDD